MNTADFAVELVMGDSMQEFHVKLLAASEGVCRASDEISMHGGEQVQVFQGIWLSRSGPHWQWLTENTRQVNGAIIECNWDPNTYTFVSFKSSTPRITTVSVQVPSDAMHYVETGDWVPGGWQFQRVGSSANNSLPMFNRYERTGHLPMTRGSLVALRNLLRTRSLSRSSAITFIRTPEHRKYVLQV